MLLLRTFWPHNSLARRHAGSHNNIYSHTTTHDTQKKQYKEGKWLLRHSFKFHETAVDRFGYFYACCKWVTVIKIPKEGKTHSKLKKMRSINLLCTMTNLAKDLLSTASPSLDFRSQLIGIEQAEVSGARSRNKITPRRQVIGTSKDIPKTYDKVLR